MKTKFLVITVLAGSTLILPSCGNSSTEETEEVKQDELVEVDTVRIKEFVHNIRIQGNVETDQDIILNAEMGGLITAINVKEGQKVSKGSVIATVDASILASNMVEIETQLEYARYMLEKQEELFKRGVGSEFDLETARNQVKALESKKASLSTQQGKAVIRAPFSGVIDQVFAKRGQMAGPQSPIVRLVNNETVDIIGSVSEKHFSKMKVGTEMVVKFPNYSDTSVQLKVTNVGNYIEPTNRTFRIKSTITDNDYFLPNMLAELSITDMKVDAGMVIDSKAVLKDQDNNDYIYVLQKDNTVKKIVIKVIERYEGNTLIESEDIKEGDLVVVKGARGVADGQKVRTE